MICCGARCWKGVLQREHLPQHHAQRPHVRLLAHVVRVAHQLRRHVRQRAPARSRRATVSCALNACKQARSPLAAKCGSDLKLQLVILHTVVKVLPRSLSLSGECELTIAPLGRQRPKLAATRNSESDSKHSDTHGMHRTNTIFAVQRVWSTCTPEKQTTAPGAHRRSRTPDT